jgi:hypothetical protein
METQENFKFVAFDMPTTIVIQNQVWRAECNTVVFWNQGDTVVTVDNLTLNPPDPTTGKEGVAYTYEGYPGEMLVRSFDIVFAVDGVHTNNKLMITFKKYQNYRTH